MSLEGIILHPGEAPGVSVLGSRIDYLVTAAHSKSCSVFEFSVAPGFDVGAHYHTKIEEFFYVLEGEMNLLSGDRIIRGGPGTFVHIPPGVAHSFANPGPGIARMLLIAAPPGFEGYFNEVTDLVAQTGRPDPEAIANLRAKYDTIQISPPRSA